MRVVATICYAGELVAGELFSTASQVEWDIFASDHEAIGQKVYIRTDALCPENQAKDIVYRITIHEE